MLQYPDSLIEFQSMFPDNDACAAWLIEMRWPNGFVCPECGHDKGWALRGKAHTFECAGCGRQTSVTSGTQLHASKLPLTVWFWAAYLMATHSNGISALQLQKQVGIGSYRTAWTPAHKLRSATVDPERSRLSGLVEVDEASLPFRTRNDPAARGQGRSPDGKMLIIGAIELGDGNTPGRLRLSGISSYSVADLGGSSKPLHIPTPPSRPMAGPATPACLPTATRRMWSGRPPLTSFSPGSTRSTPASRQGPRPTTCRSCRSQVHRPFEKYCIRFDD